MMTSVLTRAAACARVGASGAGARRTVGGVRAMSGFNFELSDTEKEYQSVARCVHAWDGLMPRDCAVIAPSARFFRGALVPTSQLTRVACCRSVQRAASSPGR